MNNTVRCKRNLTHNTNFVALGVLYVKSVGCDMSETSSSISNKIVSLLDRVDDDKKLLTFGFVREIDDKLKIPDEITNYCVIYAFLKIAEWYKGRRGYWIIDDTKLKATAKELGFRDRDSYEDLTIYGNPEISEGKYEWKIKFSVVNFEQGYVGIASDMRGLDSYFYGASSLTAKKGGYCYAYTEHVYHGQAYKMDHTMSGSQPYASGCLSDGDILTIHLDLNNKTVGFSRNEQFLGIAFEDVPVASYRLVISIYGDVGGQTFEFV